MNIRTSSLPFGVSHFAPSLSQSGIEAGGASMRLSGRSMDTNGTTISNQVVLCDGAWQSRYVVVKRNNIERTRGTKGSPEGTFLLRSEVYL